LKASGFTHAVLANNHVLDRGEAGLKQTLLALKSAGVVAVGASLTGDPCRPVMAGYLTDSVALLAAVLLPRQDGRFVCNDEVRLVAHLKELHRRGIASLVTLHWGREFDPLASREQMATATRLVAAGATVIVGNHAHVVQKPSEKSVTPSMVGTVPVWYGIGNFLFDQWQPWTRQSLAVQTDFSKGILTGWKTIALRRNGPEIRPESP
jgi:poly-gamma-glutamate capsule biosynthesis protein CapA/YwtB (metallophosphatase superfamily)